MPTTACFLRYVGMDVNRILLVLRFCKIPIPRAAKEDLHWWRLFLESWSAVSMVQPTFQQDNATPHSSPVTRKWLQDQAKKHGFSIMEWPANSPDLNPIEHVWSHIKRELHHQYPDTCHLKGSPDVIRGILKERIHKIWWDIGPALLKSLIGSMPHRVRAVVDARGNVTGY